MQTMKLVLLGFLSLLLYGCQSQGPDPRIAQLESQVSMLKGQNAALQNQQADLAKQRDSCNAKFERFTILYDVGFFNVETKAWAIPADIEPVLVTGKTGTYSHYDPKTQTETVHFKGKPAQ
jgi:outer membrane murein-binding lipoprotein Lpp